MEVAPDTPAAPNRLGKRPGREPPARDLITAPQTGSRRPDRARPCPPRPFQGFLWERFVEEFPNPLEYRVGKSQPATNWNYAQAGYRAGGRTVPHRWRIHCTLPSAPAGVATLTLAIASADRARIQVFVNDERRPLTEVTPAVQGGNASLREGIHAKYCVESVTTPADRLKAGANTNGLVLAGVRNPGAHVMYDYLSLELP